MGEEYGETNPFLFFTSHSDKQLIENVQKGRKEEFAYFNFQGDFPDPQSEATFQQSILSWNLENTHHALLLRYYRQLITFRKTLPALQQTQRHSMNIWKTNETDALLIAERVAPQQRLLLLFNCSAHPNTFQLAENKKAHTLFYSANKEWKVSNEEETTFFQHNLSYALQPFSAAILEFIE
jgi:maltooligosyltrehalose trehalohydrolase